MRIENTRAREREIGLSLSEFATSGGSPTPVAVRLHGDTTFTLEPCAEREVLLLVAVDGLDQPGDRKGEPKGMTDVDDCHVAVGDLRIAGSDVRPVRIAVAVLPRHCGPYEIECGCVCC